MDINSTLLVQSVTFIVFAIFTMKVVWPPLVKAIDERRQKIADGLAAAERGQHDIELAQKKATEILREAREQANDIVEKANKRHAEIVDAAAGDARKEAERIIHGAKAEVTQQVEQAKEALRAQVAALAVAGAEKILQRSVDASAQSELINKLAQEL
ncbi:F0F1 ATP synthase subunit B [Permianibacter aggregans]|uniref:ATP synthase subunit b n=1 Tax=Permianibacter aggregans TaxID=1510150 RepID=A0A4R6UHG3_9GAMM|nr:F0F1 ATP synthase subunit B [Permianibacter aggregans]QGX39893.1 F0F1 ATP synthase subunit B [Permianibacter aggregans]TDQ46301.1 F-type H+-transporting ATPase subunit b [Permianibacter aggregans]